VVWEGGCAVQQGGGEAVEDLQVDPAGDDGDDLGVAVVAGACGS
jgi:hypothetical protein